MNTGVHVPLSDLVSSVCMPRSGIAGSYGSSISSFLLHRGGDQAGGQGGSAEYQIIMLKDVCNHSIDICKILLILTIALQAMFTCL